MFLIFFMFLFSISCFAQQTPSIDLDFFKKSKKYSYSEKAYTVGNHSYRIVNIKPLYATDTFCISALVIDKRKYMLYDIGENLSICGMTVPQNQPISEGLIILKLSEIEGKVFFALANGKVVTLPGSFVFADTIGKCIYCIWDNNGFFRLTVFDYKNLKLIFNSVVISSPKQWFTDGFNYLFLSNDGEYFTIDFMSKKIVKSQKPEGNIKKIEYILDSDKMSKIKCCSFESIKN